jgi:hypothetical protein
MKRLPIASSILICFVLFGFEVFAQTTTWTGVSGSNWHNAANWTMGIPDLSKEANILFGSHVDIGLAVMAKRVRNEGTLTILSSASLDIENSPMTGLVNYGDLFIAGNLDMKGMGQNALENFPSGTIRLLNGGVLSIGDIVQIVIGKGIVNYGLLENQIGAQIVIQHTHMAAIENISGSISNAGTINIQRIQAEGISNKGLFDNVSGALSIKHTSAARIRNAGSMNNQALILIDSVDQIGFANGVASGVFLAGQLINLS